ncbi:LacI family transcriptional regulator [Streptomyces albus]|nr:LacI family transcriptional regulator [Streptomyces albus]
MAITSHDVARLAGVSQPTVSRALRDDSRVSAATREKVRRAAEALQYVPSEAGRTLSTRSTRRIGVIVTDLTNPFYPHIVAPLHDELRGLGYRMMLLTERSDAAVAGRPCSTSRWTAWSSPPPPPTPASPPSSTGAACRTSSSTATPAPRESTPRSWTTRAAAAWSPSC